ncbi:hypothetical protein JQ615_40895 [Bradyrhizobium jicamae]|uniref:Uncharacterized protein n=1 Tax=Bradyrhizobium jicamae TaxID=280332 RepID=A0ABS5FY04_9BRAD|nr:hypothetical protein [Bradyrhizobium jicamae]MBR0801705.1 hypothetical protein [Bradyrhizobium jicamae]
MGARPRLRACPGRPDLYRQLNDPFLFGDKATPAEYTASLKHAIEQGWLEKVHESGTFTRMAQAGKDLFA